MPTLADTLLTDDRRPATVDALVTVVEAEVGDKSGFGGAAIKTAYGAARKIDDTLVRRAVSRMLPDFLAALEPWWHDGAPGFAARLDADQDAVAESLLGVTDGRAANPNNAAIAKVYGMVRPKAKTHVAAAIPRLGRSLEATAATP